MRQAADVAPADRVLARVRAGDDDGGAGAPASSSTPPPSANGAAAHGWLAGSPRFGDAAAARIAREHGALAAWHHLWRRDGTLAAASVTGDFAVALHDGAGRSLLAVDRFAIRSLCWRVTPAGLQVAARADELADADGDGAIDPQAIFDYLYFHAIPSPRTVFTGVFRLAPGHCALFEDGRLTVQPYWRPEFAAEHGISFDARRGDFRRLLRESVATQLEHGVGGTGKPACFLSGGTDSSTIAGLIGEVSGAPAASYSIGFDADGYDEMAYARLAARHFGCEHHEHYLTPDDLLRSLPAVATHYDQPFGNSSALPAYHCARMAAADGVTQLLAGDGGDELFGGNTRYARQTVFGWYGRLPAALRAGAIEPLLLGSNALRRLPGFGKAASYVEQARVPMPERLQTYNLLLRLGVGEVLTPDYLARIDTQATQREQQAVWDAPRADDLVDRMLAYDWRYTLADNDLPKVCGTAALAGVEVGFPFLDDRLLDFAQALPVELKLKRLKLRWFFKEALRGFLPDAILTKKKHGFGLPFGVWLTRHAGLRALAEDALASLATRGIVRADFIASLLSTRLREHPSYYGEMVWILLVLELWLQGRAARRPPGATAR